MKLYFIVKGGLRKSDENEVFINEGNTFGEEWLTSKNAQNKYARINSVFWFF